MTGAGRRALALLALGGALLAGCGVDTQVQPERIPTRGLPTELHEPRVESTPRGP